MRRVDQVDSKTPVLAKITWPTRPTWPTRKKSAKKDRAHVCQKLLADMAELAHMADMVADTLPREISSKPTGENGDLGGDGDLANGRQN